MDKFNFLSDKFNVSADKFKLVRINSMLVRINSILCADKINFVGNFEEMLYMDLWNLACVRML